MGSLGRNEKIFIVLLLLMLVCIALLIVNTLNAARVKHIDYEGGERNRIANNSYFEDAGQNIYIENNTVNKTEDTNTAQSIKNNQSVQTNGNNNVTGREEKESNGGSTAKNAEEQAIELTKKEWGIDISSYNFEPSLNSDGTYTVTVRNKNTGNAITKYNVNTTTGKVTE